MKDIKRILAVSRSTKYCRKAIHYGITLAKTYEILSFIKKENIDLVIMLAHEEGQLGHFLFGRDNEKIIRKMPCSVLLAKRG